MIKQMNSNWRQLNSLQNLLLERINTHEIQWKITEVAKLRNMYVAEEFSSILYTEHDEKLFKRNKRDDL